MQGDWKLDAYLLYLLILLAEKLIGFCLLAYYSGSNSIVICYHYRLPFYPPSVTVTSLIPLVWDFWLGGLGRSLLCTTPI